MGWGNWVQDIPAHTLEIGHDVDHGVFEKGSKVLIQAWLLLVPS